MDIGIIGAGALAQALAHHWHTQGHQVVIGPPAGAFPAPAVPVVAGIRTGSALEAAKFGEIVVLAVGWPGIGPALAEVEKVEAKILVDLSVPFPDGLPVGMGGWAASGAEEIARQLPTLHVVKVYSTVTAHWHDVPLGPPPVVLYCGDNALAKRIVARLIRESKLEALDIGPLSMARYIETLALLNFNIQQHCRTKGLYISLLHP